jgi:hypothetical protein
LWLCTTYVAGKPRRVRHLSRRVLKRFPRSFPEADISSSPSDTGQQLADLVVEFAGDDATLGFLRLQQLSGKGPQLLTAWWEPRQWRM